MIFEWVDGWSQSGPAMTKVVQVISVMVLLSFKNFCSWNNKRIFFKLQFKDGNDFWLRRGTWIFLGLKNKEKVMVVFGLFFIPMVWGFLGQVLCYVTKKMLHVCWDPYILKSFSYPSINLRTYDRLSFFTFCVCGVFYDFFWIVGVGKPSVLWPLFLFLDVVLKCLRFFSSSRFKHKSWDVNFF